MISHRRRRIENTLFARQETMFNDAMIGRCIRRREALALPQSLVDAVPDSHGYEAAFDIALV